MEDTKLTQENECECMVWCAETLPASVDKELFVELLGNQLNDYRFQVWEYIQASLIDKTNALKKQRQERYLEEIKPTDPELRRDMIASYYEKKFNKTHTITDKPHI